MAKTRAISSLERRSLGEGVPEQGVAMLSSVLNSDRAILVNIQIMRVFTKMRALLDSHKEILRKLESIERTIKSS
jgi:hypothetical protein